MTKEINQHINKLKKQLFKNYPELKVSKRFWKDWRDTLIPPAYDQAFWQKIDELRNPKKESVDDSHDMP